MRRCAECAGRRLAFATARAAIAYDEHGRRLIAAWKNGGRRDLAAVAASLITSALPRPPAAVLVFVPGDRERRRKRGHVAARSLAGALGDRWGIPVGSHLRRDRGSRPQRGLALAERRVNVRGAFTAVAPLAGPICLVDDVYTTGATANECARALRRAGATRVDVVTLARALR